MQTGMPTTCPASSQSSPNVAAVTSTSITAAAGTEDGNSKTQSANAMLAKAAVPNKSSKIYRPPHLREHQPSTLPARAGTEEGAKEGLVLTQKKTESEVVQHVNEEGKSITTSMTGAAAIVTSSSTEVTTTLTRPQGSTPGSSSGAVPYFPSRPEITSLATAAANTPTAANATSYNSNTNSKNTTMGNTMPAGVGLMSVHHNMPTEYRPASYARSHNASISSGVATPACSPHSLQGGAGGGSNSSGNNTAFVTSALESQPMPYLQSNITTTGGSSTSPLSTGPGQRARVMSMSGLPTQQQYNSNSAQLPNSNSSYHHQSNTTITNNSTSSSSASPGLHLSMPNNNTTMMMATTATNSSSNGGTMSNTLPLLTTSTNSGNNTMGNMAMNGLAGPAWQAPFMYPMAGPQTLLPPPPPPPPPPPLPCYSFIHVLPAYVDACLTCTEKDRQLREQLFDKVQAIARQALNVSAEVRVHGSVMTGLALPSSDIDFLVTNYQPLAPLDAIQQLSSALLRTDATSLAEARHLAYDEAHNTENNEEQEAHSTSSSKEEQQQEGDGTTEKIVATESTPPTIVVDNHTATSTVVTEALATPSSSPTPAANKLIVTHSTGTNAEKVLPTSSHGQDLAALNEVTSAIDAELHELTKDHIAPVLPHTHHHHIHHDDDDSDAYKTREDIECAEELYRNQIEKDYSFSTPCELSPLFAAVLARQQQQQSTNSGRMSSSPRVAALLTDSHDETHHPLHEVTDVTQNKTITGSHNGEGSAREDPLTLTSPNAHHHHHHHTHINNTNIVTQHRSEFDTCCSSLSCSFPATGSALLVATGAFTSLPVGSTSPAVEKLMNEAEKMNVLAGDAHDVSDEKENQPVITATSTRDAENVARVSKGEKAAVDATLTTKDEDKQEGTPENNTSTTATGSLLVPHSSPVSTLTSAAMMPMAPMNNSQPVVVDPLLAPVLPFHAGPTLLPPRQVMMMMMRPTVTTNTNISTAANVTSSGPSFGPSQSSMMPSYLSYVPTLEGPLFLVQTIISTRVPVIKVTEKATRLRADITFAGGEHWRSMQLTRQLLTVFPHARRLILFLKHCVRALGIGDSEPGGVSSFTIYLMVRHFFNACRERIIALLEKQMAQQQQQEQKAAAGSTESSLASSSSSSSSSSSAAEVTSSGSSGQQDNAAQHQSEAGPSTSPNAGDTSAKETGRTSSPTYSHTASSSQPVQQQLQTSFGTSTAASQVPKVTTTNVTPDESKVNMPTSSNYMNVGSASTMPPQTQPPPPHYQPLSMALLEHLVRAYLLRVERQRALQQTRAKDAETSSTPASNSNTSEATPSPTGLALVQKELRTVEESILAFLGAGSSTGSPDLDLTSSAETHEMLCEGGNAAREHVDELRRGLRLSGVEEDTATTTVLRKKKTSDGSESTSRSSPVGVLREVEPTASTSASSTARLTASASTAEMSEAVAAESKKSEADDKPTTTNTNTEGEGNTSEEQRRVLRNFAEDFLRHRVTLSQVFCDFCHYYGCAFNYETEGIHFDLNGDSTVVPKPYLCARRGQYFHLTSPFDPEYDLTARMTCMREFQWLCWWFATNATLGLPELNGNDEATTPPMAMPTGCSLQYIAQWLSPMTAEADVMAVHYKLLEQYHHECAAALTAASLRGHPFELYEPSANTNGAMTTTPMMMNNNNTTTSVPMMGPGWPTMNGLPASPQMTMMTASPPQARGTVVVGGGGMAYNGFYPGFAPAVMNPQPWQNNMQPTQPIVRATAAAAVPMMTMTAMQGFAPTRQPLLPNANNLSTPIMASGVSQPTLTGPQPTVTLGSAPLLNTTAPLVSTAAMPSQAAATLVPQDESNTNTNNKAVSTTGSVQAERVSMEDTTRAHNSNSNTTTQPPPVSTATCGRSMPAPIAIDHVASPHRGEKRGEVVAQARQGTEPSEQSGMPRQEPAVSEFTRAATGPIVMPLLQLPTQGEAARVRVNSSSGSSSKGRSGGATSAPVQTANKEDKMRTSEEAKRKRESSTPKVHERSPEVGNALRQGPERLMYALHTIDSNSTSNASMTDTMTYYNNNNTDGNVDENSVANSPEKRGRKGGASRSEQRGRHNRVLTLTNTALAPHRDNGEVSPRMRSNSLNGIAASDALQQNEGDTEHNTRADKSPRHVNSHDDGQKATAEEGMHAGAEDVHDANNNTTTTASNANGDNNNSSGRSARPKHQPGLYGPEGTTAAFFYDSRRRHTMIDGSSTGGWSGNNSNKLQRPSALGVPVPAMTDNTSADPTHPRTNSSMTASTDNPNAAAGVANMYPNSPHNNNTATTTTGGGGSYYGLPSNGYMNRPNMPPPPLPQQQQQQSNGPRFMNTAERVNQMRLMMNNNNNNGYYYHSNNSSPTMPYGPASPNAGPARNNNAGGGSNAPMSNGYGNRPAMVPAMPGYGNAMNEPCSNNNNMMPCNGAMMMNNNGNNNMYMPSGPQPQYMGPAGQQQQQQGPYMQPGNRPMQQQQQGPYMPYGNYVQPPAMWGAMPSSPQQQQQQAMMQPMGPGPMPSYNNNNNRNEPYMNNGRNGPRMGHSHMGSPMTPSQPQPMYGVGGGMPYDPQAAQPMSPQQQQQQQPYMMNNGGGYYGNYNNSNNGGNNYPGANMQPNYAMPMGGNPRYMPMPPDAAMMNNMPCGPMYPDPQMPPPMQPCPQNMNNANGYYNNNNNNSNMGCCGPAPMPLTPLNYPPNGNARTNNNNNGGGQGNAYYYNNSGPGYYSYGNNNNNNAMMPGSPYDCMGGGGYANAGNAMGYNTAPAAAATNDTSSATRDETTVALSTRHALDPVLPVDVQPRSSGDEGDEQHVIDYSSNSHTVCKPPIALSTTPAEDTLQVPQQQQQHNEQNNESSEVSRQHEIAPPPPLDNDPCEVKEPARCNAEQGSDAYSKRPRKWQAAVRLRSCPPILPHSMGQHAGQHSPKRATIPSAAAAAAIPAHTRSASALSQESLEAPLQKTAQESSYHARQPSHALSATSSHSVMYHAVHPSVSTPHMSTTTTTGGVVERTTRSSGMYPSNYSKQGTA